jgi:hypothetical protein
MNECVSFMLLDIGNYYGGLSVQSDRVKHEWSIGDWTGEDWYEIPEYLYLALFRFYNEQEEREDSNDRNGI